MRVKQLVKFLLTCDPNGLISLPDYEDPLNDTTTRVFAREWVSSDGDPSMVSLQPRAMAKDYPEIKDYPMFSRAALD